MCKNGRLCPKHFTFPAPFWVFCSTRGIYSEDIVGLCQWWKGLDLASLKNSGKCFHTTRAVFLFLFKKAKESLQSLKPLAVHAEYSNFILGAYNWKPFSHLKNRYMTKQSVTQCRLLTQHVWGSAYHPSAPKQERKQKQTRISKRKTWVKHSSSLSLFSSVRVMASTSEERARSWEVCSLAPAGRKESIALWVPHQTSMSLPCFIHWAFRKVGFAPEKSLQAYLLFSSWWLWGLLGTVSIKGRLHRTIKKGKLDWVSLSMHSWASVAWC